MSPIDERLKSLNIVLPEVMPPVVDGYAPAFAPFVRSGDQIHLYGRLGKEGGRPCLKPPSATLAAFEESSGSLSWSTVHRTSRSLTELRTGRLSSLSRC
jgi:hypothetical protein